MRWRPLISCRALSAHQFSTRHNFFDITPNQVIQMAKLIYSTSSTTFMENSKPNSGQNPAKNTKQVPNHNFGPSKVHNSFNSKPNQVIQVPKFIYSTRATIYLLKSKSNSNRKWVKMASEVTQLAPELPGPVKLDTCQLPIDWGVTFSPP